MGMWQLMKEERYLPTKFESKRVRHETERIFQSQKEGKFNKHTLLQTKGLCIGRWREELMSLSAQQRSVCVFREDSLQVH